MAAIGIATLALASPARALVLYSTGNNGKALFTIDPTTGAGTNVGSFGYNDTFGLAFSPDNTLYAIVNSYSTSALATVDTATGAATPVGAGTNILNLMALVFAPTGTLYAANWGTNQLYTMDPATGAATAVGSLGFDGIMDLAFDGAGQLYGLASMGSSSSLYEIDPTTGAGTFVSSAANSCLMGLTITPANQFLATDYCVSDSPLYEINTSDGTVTNLGATGISAPMGLTYASTTAVAEPASLALLFPAVASLELLRRRNRKV
ncbi:DUF6923 family protein [Limobrevibacterium gyesilva]|nr:hypothetical protein [Limobrevibacterium gyesilva]